MEWLIYGPISARITSGSSMICASPSGIKDNNLLCGFEGSSCSQLAWQYDNTTKPTICGCSGVQVQVGVKHYGEPNCADECPDKNWLLRGTEGQAGGVCVSCQYSQELYRNIKGKHWDTFNI